MHLSEQWGGLEPPKPPPPPPPGYATVPGLCLLCWEVGSVSPSSSVTGVGTMFACTTLGRLSQHPPPPSLSSLSSDSREQMEGTGMDGGLPMRLRVHLLLSLLDLVSSCNM